MNARTRVVSSHLGRNSHAPNSVPTPTSSAARWNQGETYRVPGSLFKRQALFILLLRRDDHPETPSGFQRSYFTSRVPCVSFQASRKPVVALPVIPALGMQRQENLKLWDSKAA